MSSQIEALSQSIRESTAKFRQNLDQWCTRDSLNAQQFVHEHQQRVKTYEESISVLVAKEAALKDLSISQQKNLEVEHLRMEEAKHQLARAEQQLQLVFPQVTLVQQQVATKAQINQLKRKELEALHGSGDYQLQELGRGIQLYRERLGLYFEPLPQGQLRVVFTKIDRNDVDRPFYFIIRVDQEDTYLVDECEPPIADLPALLAQLNTSNDFSWFVQVMRQRFVSSVSS